MVRNGNKKLVSQCSVCHFSLYQPLYTYLVTYFAVTTVASMVLRYKKRHMTVLFITVSYLPIAMSLTTTRQLATNGIIVYFLLPIAKSKVKLIASIAFQHMADGYVIVFVFTSSTRYKNYSFETSSIESYFM